MEYNLSLHSRTTCCFLIYKLADSANTKCRALHVKINCFKFIINRLQQRCHGTFLILLFAASRNLLFGIFLPRKNSRKVQASVTERYFSIWRSGMFRQKFLKVPVKKLNLQKTFTTLCHFNLNGSFIYKNIKIFFYFTNVFRGNRSSQYEEN